MTQTAHPFVSNALQAISQTLSLSGETMTSQPIAQYYAIEILVSAEKSLSGEAYWSPIRLENGNYQTDCLKYAKGNLETAKQHFSSYAKGNLESRIVLVQTSIVKEGATVTSPRTTAMKQEAEEFFNALSELLSSLCINAHMALRGTWDRSDDEGFICQIDEINQFCHTFDIPLPGKCEEDGDENMDGAID
jgi:hypothetical protein